MGLGPFINSLIEQNQQNGVTFGQINEVYQFNLYKVIKPKIIYARYTSRVLPDNNNNVQSNNVNGYYPNIEFKIDYDACCVGQMTLLLTTDIVANDIQSLTAAPTVINGYSTLGTSQITLQPSQIQSFQISYGNDFLYNYIDKISLGFCNTGGGNTIWHQEVPSEIAKIYHSLIQNTGMSQTIRRMVREDVFTLQHNPYHQYGDFSFALKFDNSINAYTQITSQSPLTYTSNAVGSQYQAGFNEIAMYWVDAKIKEVNQQNFSQSINTANPQNYSIGYSPQITNVQYVNNGTGTSQYLAGFDITYISNLTFGNNQTVYRLICPSIIAAPNPNGISGSGQASQNINNICIGSSNNSQNSVYNYLQTQQNINTTSPYMQSQINTSQTMGNMEAAGFQSLFYPQNQTTLDNGDGYILCSTTVQDKLQNTISPQAYSSGYNFYQLPQAGVNSVSMQIISNDLWTSVQGRQNYFQKIKQLNTQKFYPRFSMIYNVSNENPVSNSSGGTQTNKFVDFIFVPMIIMSSSSSQYQFCQQVIINKTDYNFYQMSQYQLQISNITSSNITVNSIINFRMGKYCYINQNGSNSTNAVQIFNIQDNNNYNNTEITSDDTQSSTKLLNLRITNASVLDGTIQFNNQSALYNLLSSSILRSMSYNTQYSDLQSLTVFQCQKYYNGQAEDQGNYYLITLENTYQLASNQNSDKLNQFIYVQFPTLDSYNQQQQIYYTYNNVQNSRNYSLYNLQVDNQQNDFIQATDQTFNYDFYWNAPLFYQFTTYSAITDFTDQLATEIQSLLFQQEGAISPYLNTGSLNYLNLEIEKYDENDYALNGLAWYYTVTSQSGVYNNRQPNPNTLQLKFDIFRYNAAILNNHENEEYQPSVQNIDYQSIHTFRKYHGVVDFYFPLDFLFICQGIRNSFPHYACSAQSIVIKFDFINPLALINTCIAANPTAIDQLDFSRDARLFINRVNNLTVLKNNSYNTGFVLFYNRYQWIPEVLDVITDYQYYAWVTKNYNRDRKQISVQTAGSYYELFKYTRSVFYTKVWCFVVSQDTLQVIDNSGGFSNLLPLQVNKYSLPIWDLLTYDFQQSDAANVLSGNELATYNQLYNSVYSYVPFESVKIETDSSIQMTDELPFRFQMFNDYVMLDWTQNHSALMFNNLLQFNLDPVYWQEDAPNAVYSPAYAPQFKIVYKPKSNTNQVDKYGVILIAECINISYIQNHIMLCKYQTNN